MGSSWQRLRLSVELLMRDLVKDGWRTALTILNLLVFICSFFLLAALSEASKVYGTREENRNSLMVVSKNVFDPSDSRITTEIFEPIRTSGGDSIERVSPLIFKLIRVENYLMQVRGAVPGDFSSVFDLAPKEGSLPSGLDQAAIGEGTALLTGWKPGDIIRVFGRDFTITGIASAPGTKASSIWITLDAAEDLFSSRGIFQFAWIKLNPGVDAEQTKETLIANPRIGTDYDVFYVDHLYDQYTRGLADVITVCNVLVALALLIIMFGTYGSSFLLLAERRREITILRAIGFTAESVQGILVWRTIVQLIAAYLAAWGISAYLLQRISRVYPITVHAIPLDVVISVKILLGGLLLSLFFGILGVLLSTMHLRKGSVRSFIER